MQRILFFLSLIILCAACVEKRDLSQNTVVVDLESYPDGLHLYNSNSGPGNFIFTYTQSGLVSINSRTEKFNPVLIKQMPEVDSSGVLYKLELNNIAKWDDGSPLTVEDVIFSWKISLCPLTDNANSRNIYSTIVDSVYKDYTNKNCLYVKVKNIHYNNVNVVSGVQLAQKNYWDPNGILDKLTFKNISSANFKSSEELDSWFNEFNSADNSYIPENLKGLGPYQVTEMASKSHIILTRKKNWWGEGFNGEDFNNFPERIIFKVTTDPGAGYLSLKREDLDVLKNRGGVWISKFNRLRRNENFNENYNSAFVNTSMYRYLGMNMRPDGITNKPFFTDVRVRRAMAHLAPIEDMIEFLYYGQATRQASILAVSNKDADTSLAFIPLDLDKANKLLDEAGWVDTDRDNIRDKMIGGEKVQFSFKLNYYSDPSMKEIALVLKESMKKAGVNLICNPLDFGTLFGNAYDHKFDAMIAAWGSPVIYSDPTQLWSSESWAKKGSNFVGFGDAESDSLIVAANTSLNEKDHKEAYYALQRKIYDEQPYIFFWGEKYVMACHKRFDNLRFYRATPNINLSGLKLNYK